MSKSEAIIIGWINKGKPADCGETMKNQLMIRKLEELGIRCRQIDFKNWKRHPWVFFSVGLGYSCASRQYIGSFHIGK